LVAIATEKEKRLGEEWWPLRFAISAKCAVLNVPEKDFLNRATLPRGGVSTDM
jgi:hypothetical protein